MVEKWTAADEKLFAELNARRLALREDWRIALCDAMSNVCYYDGIDTLLDGMIDNAVAIHAALEPFVLSAGGNDNG